MMNSKRARTDLPHIGHTFMAKAPAKKNANKKGFEETLWDTANQLRGSVESSEYKHVVLSLVFLKFISDKFEAKRKQLIGSLCGYGCVLPAG